MNNASNPVPPRLALRFLHWFCPPYLVEGIEGDLTELFDEEVRHHGASIARRRFFFNVIRFCRPGIFLRNKFSLQYLRFMMLKSYFKISIRSLFANKVNTGINILGLMTGIASAIVIISIIRYEKSFDQFHTNADQIYRVVRVSQIEGQTEYRTGVSYPVPEAFKNEMTGISQITATQYYKGAQINVLNEKGDAVNKFKENNGIALADPSFFKVFDFNGTGFSWIAGNPETALTEPFSMVLTRATAQKYFGTLDVLGRTLRFEQEADFKITGVVEDLPVNSDFPFTVFGSYSTFYAFQAERMKNDWASVSDENQCYMMLMPGVTQAEAEAQMERIHSAHAPKDLSQFRSYKLQPLHEIHQDNRFGNFNYRTVSDTMILTLALVGIVMLVVACINYINLATAQSTLRSKEIGIRKVLGSARGQLIGQFLSEAFLITFAACVGGLFLAELFIHYMQPLLNVNIQQRLFLDPYILKALGLILFVMTFLAGFYPAFVVSGFSSLSAIHNRLTSAVGGGAFLRKSLVVVQFVVTQIFVIGTFIMIGQMKFFQNSDMGFEQKSIITIDIPDNSKIDALKAQLSSLAPVSDISVSSSFPSGARRQQWFLSVHRKDSNAKEELGFEYQSVDPNYLELYGISLLAGRNFTPADSAHIIINNVLGSKLGFKSPEEAIGQELIMDSQPYTVIGVTKNFHTQSLRDELDKVAFIQRPSHYMKASIKLVSTTDQKALSPDVVKNIEQIWSAHFPDAVFEYSVFEENIKAYYQEEDKFLQLLQIFSVVFLMIGCLGLYGLVAFVVNRKMKEVVIRKIHGASVSNVLMLISKDYVRLIAVAFLIAAPVAYFFMKQWLSNFVYHIGISAWVLVLPGLLVLAIALLVIVCKSLSTARVNPVEMLKHE